MEFKYLVIKCEELSDQYECDANREPLCLTNDISSYGLGYEIYEIKPDGTFECVKGYEVGIEEGMAIYYWGADEDPEDRNCKPTVIRKYKGMTRNDVTKTLVKEIKKEFGFTDSVNEILTRIDCGGDYADEINGKWIVFGEYMDNRYSLGY